MNHDKDRDLELDVKVAELLGWRELRNEPQWGLVGLSPQVKSKNLEVLSKVPFYSALDPFGPVHAWGVIQFLREKGWKSRIEHTNITDKTDDWWCIFLRLDGKYVEHAGGHAAFSICKAAVQIKPYDLEMSAALAPGWEDRVRQLLR